MPLQIIPQQNQPVGLQLLGDALMGGASDYAARRDQERMRNLALQDEQRRRGYQLSDVASNRSYEQQQQDKLRGLQFDDEQRRRRESFEDAKRRAEYERRLAMLTEAGRIGLFDMKLLGNAVAEEAALSALQTQQAKESSFAREQPINAQARLAELGQAEQAISQKMAAVEARLSATPSVDQSAVANAALQMAMQANGGKQPSREQIQAALPEAMAKAQQEAQIRWYQDKQDASVQYQLLSSQLNTIRQQQANLTSTFKVAPAATSALAVPPPSPTPAPVRGGGDTLEGFKAALSGGAGAGQAGANSALQGISDLTAAGNTAPASLRPIINQSKTAMLADAYVPFDEAANSTAAKLADVKQQIARVQQGMPANSAQALVTPFSYVPGPQRSTVDPGRALTSLLQQQAALERQQALDQQARQKNKSSLLQINTPSEAKPVVFQSAGALQSPAWAD